VFCFVKKAEHVTLHPLQSDCRELLISSTCNIDQEKYAVITRKLAAFAAELKYQDLPVATVETAKRLLLDGLGGTGGCRAMTSAPRTRRLGGDAQAMVYAEGKRNSVCHAAFANGITLYSVGLNDFLQRAGAHPGASVIPVLLAVGEWQRCSGKSLIAAMAAGYEVIDRLGRSIMPSHRERGFHPTGTCGTFGATAAAGRLLELNGAQIACAFGIAGSQAAGLYEYINDGTSTIMFHAGRAAKNGVEATLATQAGLTGPATIFEGTRGFFRATSDKIDLDAALKDLSHRYALNETTFRPYFGCTSTIAASGATAQIMLRVGAARSADVEEVNVYCNPVVAKDNAETDPRTLLGARLSLPFNVALVLAHGDVMVADLEEKDLMDSKVRSLIPKIRMISDAAIPRFGSTVEVKFKGGTCEKVAMHSWRGDADDPLPWNEVVMKFRRLVRPVIATAGQDRIVERVANIDSAGVSDLAEALSAALAQGTG
jgi:2-methylcitrate dehydratase PrpD